MSGHDVQSHGPLPELAWLPVAEFSVNHAYQRTLESWRSQQLIARIVANFRWSAFQAILAASDGDRWLVLDGQHRCEAAKQLGIEQVPAVVIKADGLTDQADAFMRSNFHRVAINPYALFHARLVAGDEAAKAIDRVCLAVGLTIPHYPKQADKMQPGETLALGSISKLVRDEGEAAAIRLLSPVADAYGSGLGLVRAPLIAAVARVINEHAAPPIAADRIKAWLTRTPYPRLATLVAKHRELCGGTETPAHREVLRRYALIPPTRGVEAVPSGITPPTRAQLMGRR